MNTPICDFTAEYAKKATVRLHMPGHKGIGETEKYDITEIEGADSLYEACGIIKESEENAGRLFGADTFYSTEGSSLCIRAMLYLAVAYAKSKGQMPRVAAGRNAHKAFLSAVALLDLTVDYLTGKNSTYLSCPINAEDVRIYLDNAPTPPTALYLTSPDYLGNMVDIASIAAVCHERDVLLLVDNAHGAYLKFLPVSLHPIDLGADACCDSAHKTLPALTGAAYLHIAKSAPPLFKRRAKTALSLFGSTSPSYLILASLDRLNVGLARSYKEALSRTLAQLDAIKKALRDAGHALIGDEPMKLTLVAKSYGYTGGEVASYLRKKGIEPEYADPDHLVLMPSPAVTETEWAHLKEVLLSLPRRAAIEAAPPDFSMPKAVLSPREAMCASEELVPVERAVGRILSCVTVGCPPAVPIVVSGERIDENSLAVFRYYGIKNCLVVKE